MLVMLPYAAMRDPAPIIDYAQHREGWGVFEWLMVAIVGGVPFLALVLLFAWEVWNGIDC
jgi:hypothetical protein